MLKLLKNLTKKEWLYAAFCVVLIVGQVWLELKIPDYMSEITVLVQTEGSKMNDILLNGGYMLLCALGSLIFAVGAGFFAASIASEFSKNTRKQIFDKVQNLDTDEIKSFQTSSLITRTTNDVTQVQIFLAMGMQAIIKAPILAVWSIIKILGKDWQWSVALAVAIGFLLLMVIVIITVAVPKFKKIQTMTDDINRVTDENLTGIRVVRASNAEDFQNEKFEKYNQKLTKTQLFVNRVMGIMNPGMTLLMSGLSLAIYWIGAYIVEDRMMLANMTTFMQYGIQVVAAFMLLIIIFILMPRALVSAKRINEVLDTKDSIISGEFKDINSNRSASVIFDHVSFKYPDADEYVLKDISFEAKEGETVAFIGSTGSGKSTLINLIPRLYDATEGKVLIDGVDVKEYDLESLNKKIGYVPQKGVLFSGTVKSNVNFGDNNADDEEVKSAISIAQASNFVSRMANGVDSRIAQGGTNVSGGQKQRLSIARAVARRPEIFIFDDSFSALDYKTDKKLRAALKKHTGKVTKFIVAQRIGTIKDADKIIVLDNGIMVGMGTHDELLKNCPVYKEIALSQLSKEEL